jgi:hypothetical protein
MKTACLFLTFLFILSTAAEHASSDVWLQTTWTGGDGQETWSDTTRFFEGFRVNGTLSPGDLQLETPNDSVWTMTGIMAGSSSGLALAEDLLGNIYCATGMNGDVFKTTNNGISWANTANMPGIFAVRSLICDSGGMLWAGVDDSGDVYTSSDGGASWNKTSELTGATLVSSLLELNGSVYAGTYTAGDVFMTTDGGATWLPTSDIAGATDVMAMLALGDTLWVGTYPNGDVFTTTDQGLTWMGTGELTNAGLVFSLLAPSDGAIYAGTGMLTGVLKTTDRGVSWFETDSLPNITFVRDLLEVDGVLYAAAREVVDGYIFKSTDGGTNWVNIFSASNIFDMNALLYSRRGFIFGAAFTSTGGKVYRAGYYPSGYLVSSVYNAPGGYGPLNWSVTANSMTTTVRVRTDSLPDMSTAPAWPSCPAVSNGEDISGISSVSDSHEYVQYRIELTSSESSLSPFIHWISLEYGTNVERDVGVVEINSPEVIVAPGSPVIPSASIANFGTRSESIWVFCEIDSTGPALLVPDIVYTDSVFVSGLAPSETTLAEFTNWTPGPSGSVYSVIVHSTTTGDTSASNDTLQKQVVSFAAYDEIWSVYSSPPTIDGVASPGEWDSAGLYEVSDLYGADGMANLPASCFARFLNDDAFLYVLIAADADTVLQTGDNASLFVDDNNNDMWEAGDMEGEYYLTHAAQDTVWFNAYPDVTSYPVFGASIAMGGGPGVLIEAALPLGTAGPLIDAAPGDTIGLFIDYVNQEYSDYVGWWPQAVDDSLRTEPLYFGNLILEPPTGLLNGRAAARHLKSGLVAITPNPFKNQTEVTYTQGSDEARVSLSVYDVSGRLVRRLVDAGSSPGIHSLTWDGRSEDGKRLQSGAYILRLKAGDATSARKLTLVD